MLKRFLAYYRPHLGLLCLDLGCAVASGVMELGFPLAIKAFVDDLLPLGDPALILLAAAALLAVYLANAGLGVVVAYWGHMLGVNIETEMRRRAFDHLQKLSFRFFDAHKTGHLVGRVTKDLEEIGEVAHHGPEDLLIALMTFGGAFGVMLWVHPPLAWITAIAAPVVAVVTARYGGRMTRTWQELYGRVGDFNVRIEESVGGVRVVQAFANEDHERARFAESNAAYRRTKLAAYRIMAGAMALGYVGMRAVMVLVMVAGAHYVVAGSLSPGGFVGFLLLVGVFFRPLERITTVIEMYPRGIAGFRRYCELLATAPDVADRPGARPAPPLGGEVTFAGVRFGYDPARPVLKDFDLVVPPGRTVALVGPSGVGKTTICSLLPRFYDVDAGAVRVDGVDVRDYTLASLRGQIGIVQQEVFLFGGTLRENIAYGRLDASEAEIREAARRARLETLIADLPQGLDTVVGERGVKLSGGQRQRVAIARMFLKNPPILILDEATSALDSRTEREIRRALSELARGRTTLIIAHRLATVRDADLILEVGPSGAVRRRDYAELIAGEAALG
ncbi:Uncharacterized ABC transporter ATP-binding protein YwjA [uncultured Alphaproteobacteria bacterium]|uniref:Uncharacterized ABC transporter ATP-binding protein YwjA n=1 Tax=uncultured Alphaproteobacteria bacterium TaxID=91750 RepID=A0A212KJN7_9PROT|nr:Uncharacterized ABC transporter ATP-binding protein YwjA [uncultured Alphaproteobacteria bacterium]